MPRKQLGFFRIAALTLLASLSFQPVLASATSIAKQFSSPEAMAEALNDFPPETGAFRVVRKAPLHIRLNAPDQLGSPDVRNASEEMFRAFLWGVYRTFLHTTAKQVTVSVAPPRGVNLPAFSETVTREHAVQVARDLLKVDGLNDLITDRQTWSEPMKRCRSSDAGAPGLKVCALTVAGKI